MFNKFKYIILLTVLAMLPAQAVDAAVIKPKTEMGSAVVIQAKTGQVLADNNGSARLPIASVSKLIVVYMLEQKISENKLALNQKVTVPADIAKFSQNSQVANVPLSAQRTYTISQLLDATLIESSNSAAMELAHLVAGSQANYYQQAEALLNKWGIKDAKIYSASGLQNDDLGQFTNKSVKKSDENKLSAREIALIAKHLVNDYPHILDYTQKQSAPFPSLDGGTQTLKNTNLLLGNQDYQIDGLKTGLTPKNGSNLVTHGVLNKQPVITVVLNTNKHPREAIFKQTLSVLGQVKQQTVAQTVQAHGSLKVANAVGNHGKVPVTSHVGQQYFVSKADQNPTKIVNIQAKQGLSAPMQKNDAVAAGKIKFANQNENDFIDGKTPNIKLYPTHTIKKAGWFTTILQKVS